MQRSLTEYNSILRLLDDVYGKFKRCFDLPGCSVWVLYTLRTASAPCTQAEICEGMMIPKQSINSAIKRLLADGCIALKQGGDRREKLISLTEKGKALAARTVDRMIAEEEKAFLAMPESERMQFLWLFRRYAELLKAGTEIAIRTPEEGEDER